MSVEDVMKVNKLAKELLDQGIVASRDDAVKRAQEMLNKDIVGNDMSSENTNKSFVVEDSSIEKMRNMIERVKENTERRFESYKNALIGLEKEMYKMKEEIASLRAKGIARSIQNTELESKRVNEASEPAKEVQQEIPRGSSETNQRKGNFRPEDVSVEKMFYYGNK